jgi:hypothetical protein
MSAYLNHITLETGHVHRSPRADISAETLQFVTPHLMRAIERGEDVILAPGETGEFVLRATAAGAFLLATAISRRHGPLITFGVAPRSRNAGRLWESLHQGRTVETHRGDVPAAPWLAARMETTNVLALASARWLADYSRCLAWAWIESRKAG